MFLFTHQKMGLLLRWKRKRFCYVLILRKHKLLLCNRFTDENPPVRGAKLCLRIFSDKILVISFKALRLSHALKSVILCYLSFNAVFLYKCSSTINVLATSLGKPRVSSDNTFHQTPSLRQGLKSSNLL